MSDIGGNTTAILQVQSENGVDEIGNPVISWEDAGSYPGWLDLVSGNSPVQNYKDEALKVLPYHIYYPDPTASQSEDVFGKAVVDGPEENEE